ncbi:MAG: hypothetical protein HOO06_10295 [Bdellovibrionaceae bacterium]|jgi:hypothetical protein|nr:hypothetical protein [Pseudobdellovibrionaceae bacterium]
MDNKEVRNKLILAAALTGLVVGTSLVSSNNAFAGEKVKNSKAGGSKCGGGSCGENMGKKKGHKASCGENMGKKKGHKAKCGDMSKKKDCAEGDKECTKANMKKKKMKAGAKCADGSCGNK